MSTYDEIRQSRKTSSQVLAEQQADDPYGIDLAAMKQSDMMRGYKPIVTDDPIVEQQAGRTAQLSVLPVGPGRLALCSSVDVPRRVR